MAIRVEGDVKFHSTAKFVGLLRIAINPPLASKTNIQEVTVVSVVIPVSTPFKQTNLQP
jgi:hypothetical protein